MLKPYIFPVSFVGLLSRVFTQRNPAGSMLKILLMLQKSGEKTTWDGAKTLQKEWDTNWPIVDGRSPQTTTWDGAKTL